MPEKTLGQIAYEAYANSTGWKSLATGQDLPQWGSLMQEIQEAWEASANAVRMAISSWLLSPN